MTSPKQPVTPSQPVSDAEVSALEGLSERFENWWANTRGLSDNYPHTKAVAWEAWRACAALLRRRTAPPILHSCHWPDCERTAGADARYRWVMENCRVVFYPPDGSYPIEHTMAARKDARIFLEPIMDAALAPPAAGGSA